MKTSLLVVAIPALNQLFNKGHYLRVTTTNNNTQGSIYIYKIALDQGGV